MIASFIYLVLFFNFLDFYKIQTAGFRQKESGRKRERRFCNRILLDSTLSSLLAKGLCENHFQDLSLKGSQRLHKRTGPKWLITFNLWPFTQLPYTLWTWKVVRECLAILFTNSLFIPQEQLGRTYPGHLTLCCHRNHETQAPLVIKPKLQHSDGLKSVLDCVAIINHLTHFNIAHFTKVLTHKMWKHHNWTTNGISHAFHGREKKHTFLTWILQVSLNYHTVLDLAKFISTQQKSHNLLVIHVFSKLYLCFSQSLCYIRHLPEEITSLNSLSPPCFN